MHHHICSYRLEKYFDFSKLHDIDCQNETKYFLIKIFIKTDLKVYGILIAH